jgi:quercetin dioxygenase-like cupin family protein
LAPFSATGLPAGAVTGVPWHKRFPAGFTLKHIHGGPAYVYVISGSFTISDAQGTKKYGPGSFFWEPAGHVHTFHVIKETEVFVLLFLPPGAAAIVPVK